MFDGCSQRAIKSHVLQKNGILREISEDNHLIQLLPPSPFELNEKGISEFKNVGINDVYTFDGFCNTHDTEVFKTIETNANLDLKSKNQQVLFFYRGLCQELRRKEIGIEMLSELRGHFPAWMLDLIDLTLDGFRDGVKNITFFKNELESAIKTKSYDKFYAETVKLPRIELCISVPLNIGDLKIPGDNDYEKWKQTKKIPFSTSFINIFPKGRNTYAICGYHVDYPCEWTDNLIKELGTKDRDGIFKLLSDLVTLRLEFWTMSQKLFKSIGQSKLNRYKEIFSDNIFNHSPSLTTDLNLFEGT